MADDLQKQLLAMVRDARRVVFFGGAGVSTESGIPDFRSAQGLYNRQTDARYAPEEMLSHDFFFAHTELFYDFYRKNLLCSGAKPNKGHYALSAMEARGKLVSVVTQNIDGLHQAASSKRVHELHGSVQRNACLRCGRQYDVTAIQNSSGVPKCACGGVIKPDVVLYGEGLDERVTDAAVRDIQSCDLLIVGGTSLSVYPAAGFVRLCPGNLVIINQTPTAYDRYADLSLASSVGETLHACASALEML